MQDDNRETEIEMKKLKILSEWEREEVFFVRWFTFGISTIIVLPIWVLFFNLNDYIAFFIIVLNWIIPPFFFFRKGIKKLLKEKVSYWWSMLNGRIP